MGNGLNLQNNGIDSDLENRAFGPVPKARHSDVRCGLQHFFCRGRVMKSAKQELALAGEARNDRSRQTVFAGLHRFPD